MKDVKEKLEKIKKNKILYKVIIPLLYLCAAWIVFSMQGFLPKKLSFPIPEEKQKYNSSFYLSGYSLVSDFIHFWDDSVPAGTINSLDVLSNNNIRDSRGYYDLDEDTYYVVTKNYVYQYKN